MQRCDIVCLGEILWDAVPRGLLPGGAPMNLAYHLARLGWRPWLVSSVGQDVLGDELLRRLGEWDIDTTLVRVAPSLPTGLVRVVLERGVPRYTILEGVAWDDIRLPAPPPAVLASARALVFGSLAMRTSANRACLEELFRACPTAMKVFDVNLRAPWIDVPMVQALVRRADLVKVNDEELGVLLGSAVAVDSLEAAARRLVTTTDCPRLCVTAGAHGAGLLADGQWHWVQAERVDVRDTIGAGDAFLSAVVDGVLRDDRSPAGILAAATRLAAFVAARDGATPPYERDAAGNPRD